MPPLASLEGTTSDAYFKHHAKGGVWPSEAWGGPASSSRTAHEDNQECTNTLTLTSATDTMLVFTEPESTGRIQGIGETGSVNVSTSSQVGQ